MYTATKEYEKAEVDYANYLAVDQTNAYVYQNYGVVLQHLGKENEALVHFNRSLELEPYSEPSLLSRGKQYLSDKKYELALKDFSRFIDYNKQSSSIFTYRAKCYLALGMIDRAFEDLNLALNLDPHNIMALIERSGIYHSRKSYD